MAVRTANYYQFETIYSVFGSKPPDEVFECDYPVDQYLSELDLDEPATAFQDVVESYFAECKGEKPESVGKFKGKREKKYRLCTWSDLRLEQRRELYKALYPDLKLTSIARVAEAVEPSLKKYLFDCKAKFSILALLANLQGDSDSKTIVKSSSAIALKSVIFNSDCHMSDTLDITENVKEIVDCESTLSTIVRAISTVEKMTKLPGRIAKARDVPHHKSRVVKQICKSLWLNEESDIGDMYIDIAMGNPSAGYLEQLEDELEDEEVAFNWVKAESLEEKIADAKKVLKLFTKIGEEVHITSVPGLGTVVYNSSGFMVKSDFAWIVLSLKDLGAVRENLEELMSCTIDMAVSYSQSVAANYFKTISEYWLECATLSADDAGYMSVAQRDFELDARALTCSSFDTDGNLINLKMCIKNAIVNSPTCAAVIKNAMAKAPRNVDKYHWARNLRCIPLHHFSIPCLCNETFKAHSMVFKPSGESLTRLRACLKLTLGRLYNSLHGKSPPGFDEIVSSVDASDGISKLLDKISDWDMRGVAPFDPECACVRDKANIPMNDKILDSSESYNSASEFDRREILYFSKKDWKRESRLAMANLGRMKAKKVKVRKHDGVKPESKENGRSVSSERSDIRKANSISLNNLLPYANFIEGSFMSASPTKKDNIVNKLAASGTNMRLKGFEVLLLATDFVKFGHSLPIELQKVLYEALAEFFDQPWMEGIPEMLLAQEICVIHQNQRASFLNETGGDGQGMRNAAWQVMLAAAVVFVTDELSQAGFDFSESNLFSLLYFMDDHLFKLIFKAKVDSDGRPDKATTQKVAAYENAIAKAYGKIGLGMNPEKNSRSFRSSILIGMKVSTRGREHVAGRAIQRLLVSPSHRCPSLTDLVSGVYGAAFSAVEDGLDRCKAIAAMTFGASFRMSQCLPARNENAVCSYAIRLSAPIAAGGLGMPCESNLVVNCGVNKFDDFLTSAFLWSTREGKLSTVTRSFLSELKKSGKCSIVDVIRNPCIINNQIIKAPSSCLFETLRDVSDMFNELEKSYKVKVYDKHLEKVASAIATSYESLPCTLIEAIVNAHPASVAHSDVERIALSATCQTLMNPNDLSNARRITRSRDTSYLSAISTVKKTSQYKASTFADFMDYFGSAASDMKLDFPPRGPRFMLVLDAEGDTSTADVEVTKVKPGDPYGVLNMSAGIGSYSRGSKMWQDPIRSAINGAVDCYLACASTFNGDRLCEIINTFYGAETISALLSEERIESPFKDLSVVQYAPQSNSLGIRCDLRSHYAASKNMTQVRRYLESNYSTKSHVNHGAALVTSTAMAARASHWHFSTLAIWSEPIFRYRNTPSFGALPTSLNLREAKSFVEAVDVTEISMPAVEHSDAEVPLGKVLDKILVETAVRNGTRSINNFVPTLPVLANTPEDNYVLKLVEVIPASKQVDFLIQVLSWDVLHRIVDLDSSSRIKDDVWDHIESFGRGGKNTPTGDMPKPAKYLIPTLGEAERICTIANKAGIIDPFYNAIARIISRACGDVLEASWINTSQILVEMAARCWVFWGQNLNSQLGGLCAMECPYSDTEAYRLSSRHWCERHRRTYVEAATILGNLKDVSAQTPTEKESMSLLHAFCFTYEVKARILEALYRSSVRGVTARNALQSVKDSVWCVFARAISKRNQENSVRVGSTIKSMAESLQSSERDFLHFSCQQVRVSLKMVLNDLNIHDEEVEENLESLSNFIGDTSATTRIEKVINKEDGTKVKEVVSVYTREIAETQQFSTAGWFAKVGNNSFFGDSLAIDLEAVSESMIKEMLGVDRWKGGASVKSQELKAHYKVRSKVKRVEGSQTHQRSHYGRETHPVQRHGRTSSNRDNVSISSKNQWFDDSKTKTDASSVDSLKVNSRAKVFEDAVDALSNRSGSYSANAHDRMMSPLTAPSVVTLETEKVSKATLVVESSKPATAPVLKFSEKPATPLEPKPEPKPGTAKKPAKKAKKKSLGKFGMRKVSLTKEIENDNSD